jgi:hypothetical protein
MQQQQQQIEEFIKSCSFCARNKTSTQAPAGFLHPMPIPQDRFTDMAMDFVGAITKSKEFDTILSMMDRLTISNLDQCTPQLQRQKSQMLSIALGISSSVYQSLLPVILINYSLASFGSIFSKR